MEAKVQNVYVEFDLFLVEPFSTRSALVLLTRQKNPVENYLMSGNRSKRYILSSTIEA